MFHQAMIIELTKLCLRFPVFDKPRYIKILNQISIINEVQQLKVKT